MAVMKKKGSKGLPPISTASLPDVIFMILFFFMVSTTMRDQELLVRYKLPEATGDILDFVAAERDKLSEADRASMTICLKADEATKMGIVTDVKQELRRANALKLSYAASKSLGY